MLDERRLRQVTPGRRGWRFVGPWRGRILRANVRYLVVTAAAVTRHYTAAGASKRVAILAQYGVAARALGWRGDRWQQIGGRASQQLL